MLGVAVPPPRWDETRPFFLGSSGLSRLTLILGIVSGVYAAIRFGDAFVMTSDDEQVLLSEARWDLSTLQRGLFFTGPFLLLFSVLVAPAIVAGLLSARTARMVEDGKCNTPLEKAHRDVTTRRLLLTWRALVTCFPLLFALHSFAAGDVIVQRSLLSGGVFTGIVMWALVDVVGAQVTTLGIVIGSLVFFPTTFLDLDSTPLSIRVTITVYCVLAAALTIYVINATEMAKHASFSALAGITERRLRAAEVFSSIMPRHVAEAVVSGGQGDKEEGDDDDDDDDDARDDNYFGSVAGRDRIDDVASSTVIMVQVKLAAGLRARLTSSELMTAFLTELFDACDTALDAAGVHGVSLHLRRGHSAARGIRPDISKVENQPDLYIASCGLGGVPGSPHATWACLAAAEIAGAVRAFEESGARGAFPGCTGLRVGVATGPVAGGLNGTGALVYSVYGSTVNLSSRVAAWSGCGERTVPTLLSSGSDDKINDDVSDGEASVDKAGDGCVHLAPSVVEALRREGSLPFFDLTETPGVNLKGIAGEVSVYDLHGLSRIGAEISTVAADVYVADINTARSYRGTGRGGRSARINEKAQHRTTRRHGASDAYITSDQAETGSLGSQQRSRRPETRMHLRPSSAQSLLNHAFGGLRVTDDMGDGGDGSATAGQSIDGTDPVLEALISEGGTLASRVAGGGSGTNRDTIIDTGIESAVTDDVAALERPVAMAIGVLLLLVATTQMLLALEAGDTLPDVDPVPLYGFAGAICVFGLSVIALYARPPRRREWRDVLVTTVSCVITGLLFLSGLVILWDAAFLGLWGIFMGGLLPFVMPRSNASITATVSLLSFFAVIFSSTVGPLKGASNVDILDPTPRGRMLVVMDSAVIGNPLRNFGNGALIFIINVMVILQRSRAVRAFRATRLLERFGRREAHRFESLVAQSLPAWAMERLMTSSNGGQRTSGPAIAATRNAKGGKNGGGEIGDTSIDGDINSVNNNKGEVVASRPVVSRDLDSAVCFQSDVVGFTSLSSGMEAAEVLRMLHAMTAEMDKLALRHGVEKIGTVGDAYLAYRPGGTPADVAAVCLFASEAIAAVAGLGFGGRKVQVRAGVGIGPLALGVLGTRMPMLRAWGPALEEAARMESSGVASRVAVSREVAGMLDGARGVQAVPDGGIIHVID